MFKNSTPLEFAKSVLFLEMVNFTEKPSVFTAIEQKLYFFPIKEIHDKAPMCSRSLLILSMYLSYHPIILISSYVFHNVRLKIKVTRLEIDNSNQFRPKLK